MICVKVILSIIYQAYHKVVKNMFPLHIYRPNDYTAEISFFAPTSALQYFIDAFSNIFRSFN